MNIRLYIQQAHRLRTRLPKRLKPIKASRATELWYRLALLGIVSKTTLAIRQDLMPGLKEQDDAGGGLLIPAGIGLGLVFSRLKERLDNLGSLANSLANGVASRALKSTDWQIQASIRQVLGKETRPMFGLSDKLLAAVESAAHENASLIRSIPTQYLERVQKAVTENLAAGKRHTDIAREIIRIEGMTENRAKLIARDQVAKMNSSFNEIRQREIGIERYQWQTSGDERVRDTHAELDGRIFRWDDPPPVGHPGMDIQCRCVAIPYLDLPPAYIGQQP